MKSLLLSVLGSGVMLFNKRCEQRETERELNTLWITLWSQHFIDCTKIEQENHPVFFFFFFTASQRE